jgi:hypothetical protein
MMRQGRALPLLDGEAFRKDANGPAQHAAALMKVAPGVNSSDLGCGRRHTVALACLGYRLTGGS